MRNLFNVDNPFWSFLTKVADLIILNILFIITSIPILTIGAAFTTLNSITLKISKKQEVSILRDYISTFKENFKQSTIIWLIMLVIGIILFMDLNIITMLPINLYRIMFIAIFMIIILYSLILFYVFPYISRFEVNTKMVFKNSLIISILNLPYTILIIGFTIFIGSIVFWNPFTFIWGLGIWILIGFSITSLVNSYFFNRVFKRYEAVDCIS